MIDMFCGSEAMEPGRAVCAECFAKQQAEPEPWRLERALDEEKRRMTNLERIDGLFGQLNERELRTFERAVEDGEARRSYEGGAGFMGLAKVRLNHRGTERN
jgi:hypothetical protein